MAARERLFPFSDNVTTLMFIVACDLSEAQRERLKSSLSLQGVDVTAYTVEKVRTVFVNRCSSHTSRTFIIEDFIENEFGQWATDEVTGEQGNVDDEGSCFWTWDNNENAWQSRPFRSRKLKKKTKGKGKGKGGFKRNQKSNPC